MKDVTRLTWSGSLACALLASSTSGCSSTDRPPAVSSMSPTAGDYGTSVTIDGEELELDVGGASITLQCGTATPMNFVPGESPSVLTSADATAIDFRFPFPCEGEVKVSTSKGTAIAGSFTPSWKPDTGILLEGSATNTLDTIALAGGPLSMLIDGSSYAEATLVIFDGGSATSFPLERGDGALSIARFFPRTDGQVEGVAITGATPPMLVHFVGMDQSYTIEPTGLQALDGFLAAGVDATGVYAWIRTRKGMTSRVRPSASGSSATWTADRGPIADSDDYTDSPSGAVAADGTLLFAGGHFTGDFTDNNDTPFVCWLHPTDTAFGSCELAGTAVDDYLISTRLQTNSDGTHLWLTYCSGMHHLLGTDTTSCGGSLLRATDGTWTAFTGVGDGTSSDDLFALSETGFAALVRRDDQLQLFTDTGSAPTVLPVWPAGPGAFALSSDGTPRYAVSSDLTGLLYAPTKR